MYYALNKTDNNIYHIGEWISNPKLIDRSSDELKFLINPVCCVCNNTLAIRPKGGSHGKENIHFWHNKHNTGCPTIEENKLRYIGLKDNKLDKNKIISLKQSVIIYQYSIYLKCNEMCDNTLTIKDYVKLLANFRKENIWNYRNLKLGYIPYMLLHLTCCIKKDFYFVLLPYKFDPGDLWIDSHSEKYLQRINVKNNTKVNYSISNKFLARRQKSISKYNYYINEILNEIKLDYENEEKPLQKYCERFC